jgi:methylase of polypeptide subunit release factors
MFHWGERAVRARANSESVPIRERLALATFLVLIERFRELINRGVRRGSDGRVCLIYYTDLLQCAVLVGFQRVGEFIEIRSGLAIPNPHAYLDPVQALSYATTRAHVDLVKLALAGPVRLVGHRDVVVAVNRNTHAGVFGPTIDTLFLCDWLYSRIFIREECEFPAPDDVPPSHTVDILEVGCGNGMISASFVREVPAEMLRLEAIDIDPRAVLCTAETVQINSREAIMGVPRSSGLTVAAFSAKRYVGRFDYIVCNPPYIPMPETLTDRMDQSKLTTHGPDLIEALIQSASDLLKDTGQLIMVSSRLAEDDIAAATRKAGLLFSVQTSRRVPFDIEDLQPDHLDWLRSYRGLEVDENHSAFHEIAIYTIELPREQ